MKRKLTLIILLFLVTGAFAQWNDNFNIENKCTHQPKNQKMAFEPEYSWQSDLLFKYDVKFYWLDIEVTNTETYVSGSVTINATSIVTLDTFAFELVDAMTIDAFLFNGVQYDGHTRQQDNVLYPIDAIGPGEDFTVTIFYHGNPQSGGFFSGLSYAHSNTWDKDVVWTLSEPFNAKVWFPVKQDLEDKADSVWVFLTTPPGTMAGSQGLLTNIVPVADGKTRYEWKSKYPIDYYLISYAVTDYQEYNIYAYPEEMNGDSVLIQNFLYNSPGYLENNKAAIDETAQMLELLSNLYILYPFHEEKYGHCVTQLGGGMEHQTMTTIGGFNFGLVAHELGHMWFGDNVTCATWSDIWINEGFATYSDNLCREYILGWNVAEQNMVSKQQDVMSSAGGSVYIPENEISEDNVWRIFNGRLSYNKGAVILHMLRHEIQNDSIFYEVMGTFQTQYSGSTATGDDFRDVAEDVTGMDFHQFFDQWYYGQGYPIYNYEWYSYENSFYLTSTQTTSTSVTPLFQMLMDYQLNFSDGTDTIVHLYQTDNLNQFEVYTGKTVVSIEVDPNNWTMEYVQSITVVVEEKDSPVYFSVGPNPAKDYLNVYLLNPSSKEKQIDILDISGKVIRQTTTFENKMTLNTSLLPAGVYLVRVHDGQNTMVRRFIR
ncbi:MAG TPA: M1 family aminopeptidase [Bacteroidales bacterium]